MCLTLTVMLGTAPSASCKAKSRAQAGWSKAAVSAKEKKRRAKRDRLRTTGSDDGVVPIKIIDELRVTSLTQSRVNRLP